MAFPASPVPSFRQPVHSRTVSRHWYQPRNEQSLQRLESGWGAKAAYKGTDRARRRDGQDAEPVASSKARGEKL